MSWIILLVAAGFGYARAPWYAPAAISVAASIPYTLVSAYAISGWRQQAGLGDEPSVRYVIAIFGAIAITFLAWAIGRGVRRLISGRA